MGGMSDVPRLNAMEADAAHAAAQKVVEVHRRLSKFLRIGMTLGQIDTWIGRTLQDLGVQSCFRGYVVRGHPPFPSHACLSVNECVVHGTAGYYRDPLKPGDVLKIDIGVWHRVGGDQWVGDAAWTYAIGEPTPVVARLMECGKKSLAKGVEELRPGRPYLDWAVRVQDIVEKEYGFFCVENWGGHGIGRKIDDKSQRGLHLPPHLLNHRPRTPDAWPEGSWRWEPGNLVAVEPMIAQGTGRTVQRTFEFNRKQTDWPVFIADGSLSVHYEHNVLITDNGPRVLTEGLEEVPDIITR
jgi:methionyl aminopeptidase